MKIFRKVIGGTLKSMIDVPRWLGWKQLKYNVTYLFRWLKPYFKAQKITRRETFQEAVARLDLTEDDLQKRAKHLIYECMFYLSLACICLGYTFFLFCNKHIIAGIFAIIVSALILIKAGAAHFLRFQIKHHKLGCTIREWINGQTTNEEAKS